SRVSKLRLDRNMVRFGDLIWGGGWSTAPRGKSETQNSAAVLKSLRRSVSAFKWYWCARATEAMGVSLLLACFAFAARAGEMLNIRDLKWLDCAHQHRARHSITILRSARRIAAQQSSAPMP